MKNTLFLSRTPLPTRFSAATTYDITKLMVQAARVKQSISVVSLLQPPPETVANFDELILISDGMIIYRLVE